MSFEDKQRWHELAVRYAIAVDQRDAAGVAALFTEDGVVVVPEVIAGPEGRRIHHSQIVDAVRRFERTRHVVQQQQVRGDGSSAAGLQYGQAHHLYRKDGRLHDYVMTVRYEDTFVAGDGGWYFSRREMHVDWTEYRQVHELAPRRETQPGDQQ